MSIAIPLPQVQADFSSPVIPGARSARTDNSGLIQSLEALKTAGAGVRIPVPNYAVGTDAVGQGIMQAGQQALQIANRRQELQNLDKQMMIESQSTIMQAELDAELKGIQDPSKWEDHAAQKIEKFVAGISTDGMTDRAASHIRDIFVPTLQKKLMATVKGKATVEQEQRTRQSGMSLYNLGVDNKDPVMTGQAINTMLQANLLQPEEAALLAKRGATTISQKAASDLTDEIKNLNANGDTAGIKKLMEVSPDAKLLAPMDRRNVEAFVQQLDKMQTISNEAAINPYGVIAEGKKALAGQPSEMFDKFGLAPAQIDEAVKDAERQASYKEQQAFDLALDRFADGTLKTVELDDPKNTDYFYLRPMKRLMLKDRINGAQPKADGREFVTFATSVEEMPRAVDNPSPEERLAISDWQSQVKLRFSPERAATLLQMQDEHWKGSPAETSNDALKKLRGAFKNGYLGNYTVPYEEDYNPNSFTRFFFGREARTGTPISPKDRERLKMEGGNKLEKGEPVINQKLYQDAAKALEKAEQQVIEMRKQGKSKQEQDAFVESVIRTVPLQKAAITNPATLFPPLEQTQDISKELLNILNQ